MDKILKDRDYEIALNPKFKRYQRGLASILYKIFNKKIGSRTTGNVRELLA